MSAHTFNVQSITAIMATKMLRKETRPINLPRTISDKEIGALNKKVKVLLLRSSLINRIESKGTENNITKDAKPNTLCPINIVTPVRSAGRMAPDITSKYSLTPFKK